ncbi:hypothetical protein [uncultured Thiodictyon sp.]|uniref:hypothetical protein n=1 Tax=uncultured Thiodictyon sp. TaxID=1846217 RepID=UPI0025D4B301|nr:hypothetical protein [uncultured Thiodictyon sp.]
MLNWDDPLAVTRPAARTASAAVQPARPTQSPPAPARWSAHDTSAHVRPGRGVVENATLMSTAGSAPVVDPNPFQPQVELPFEDTLLSGLGGRQAPAGADTEATGGASGLESLEMGAGRVRVDDKRIINCRADLNQLVPFKATKP